MKNFIFFLNFIFFAFLAGLSHAEAKVFNFQEQTLSTYLRGTYGYTNLQGYGYQPSFPPSVAFPGGAGATNASQSYSGEIGIAYTTPKACTLRFGVELLYPAQLTGVVGTNAAGAALFSLTSQVYSVIPQVNLEYFVKKGANARVYVGGGTGYAVTTLKNTVSMTPQGNTTLGITDYIEEATGWGIMGQGFTGVEFAFFDNVATSFDVGYRYLVVNNYTTNRGFQSPAGNFASGNPLKNFDGSGRYTDLGGLFATINFRIYIY